MPFPFLNPSRPGSFLAPATGDDLTPSEELVVQAINAGTYFVENETPSGSGTTRTLAGTPNPAASLQLFVKATGQKLNPGIGEDYTLSGATITLAQDFGALIAHYRVAP